MSLLFLYVFVGVFLLLTLVAWVDPTERGMLARARALRAQRSASEGESALSAGSLTARLLKGERKTEKPCLTPIDCVLENRCAGHCGCR